MSDRENIIRALAQLLADISCWDTDKFEKEISKKMEFCKYLQTKKMNIKIEFKDFSC